MDDSVLKKVCKFLKKQTDQEAVFQTFWEGTKELYPSEMSKTKIKAWLKEHPGRFELIKSKTGDPFGKIKLKVEAPSVELPETTTAEDREITRKLIESVDNTIENGHLFAIICKNKAEIFPEQLQDKKLVRKWLSKHEDLFKMVPNISGGLHSIEVLDKARRKNRKAHIPPATTQKQASISQTTPKKAQGDTGPVDLFKLAESIVERISERIKNNGGTVPFESLLKAKDVISPLCEEDALNTFLTKFPEKFELIDLEGIGKWVRSKATHKSNEVAKDAVNKVIHFIFKNGGTVPFANLVKEANALVGTIVNSPDDLLTWLGHNANNFEVIPKPDDPLKPWQVKVKFGSYPRFCQHYLTRGQCPKKKCQFLHICKAYICQCPHEQCNFSHDIRDEHNKTIIDKMGALSRETDEIVRKVLLKSCFPRVCVDYNKSGVCPRGDNCHFLHVCGSYVLNECENPLCSLSHNMTDSLHNINVLKRYALLPSQKLSVEIVKTNIAFAQIKPQPPVASGFSSSIDVELAKLHLHLLTSRALSPTAAEVTQPQQDNTRGEKKNRRRPRRRRRKRGQASSAANEGSSAETGSSGDDDDGASIASSSCSAGPSLLSPENIQKSNLAMPLSGAQKVGNWMGNYEFPSQQRPRSDSTSSSDVSFVSNQSSVVSSHSSMWQDSLEKRVFIEVLDKYNGEAQFNKISKDKELFGHGSDPVKWFKTHSRKFILNENGQGKIDSVSSFSMRARICLDYNQKRGCDKPKCGFLHLCRNYIETHCPEGKACSRSHDLGSDQVSETVKRMGLPDLTTNQLATLIRFSVPKVCHFYNQGGCNRGEFCPNLHVCKEFIKGRRFCKEKPCKFGHENALKQAPATKLLKMYRLHGKQPNFKYIRKMIFETRKKSGVTKQDSDAQRELRPLMDVDLTAEVYNQETESEEVVPNICIQFLTDHCRSKKCPNAHFPVPYSWQFKLLNTPGPWRNFNTNDCEMIEKYFCDVNCAATELDISSSVTANVSSVRLDFQSMSGHPQPATGDSFQIRRLQCEQSEEKREDDTWYETNWLWYELKSSKWIKYETAEAAVFEKLFLKGSLPVDWSTHRRRPGSFLTKNEVKKKKRDAQEQQATEFAPPPQSPVSSQAPPQSPVSSQAPQRFSHSVRENVPFSNEPHRTRVEPGTSDYKDVEELLVDSTGQNTLFVNQIDKIVSDNLWDKYKCKKKSMTDELRPGEKLNEGYVFMPCLREDLERIMKGNVCDSRIILPEPLGRGYYFTSNASFCVDSCREHLNLTHSQFYLIVCQVLLGTCTQGAQGITEFPRRSDGRFYDSLVDNKDDPSVLVIKDIAQCYPTFVIDFSSAAPSNEGFENVHESSVLPQPIYPQVPPAYQDVSHVNHPLSQAYVPPSPRTTPSSPPAYVKAVPVNSGISPPTSGPPPYTRYPFQPPQRAADSGQPGNLRPVVPDVRSSMPSARSTARQPGDIKDKNCVVM